MNLNYICQIWCYPRFRVKLTVCKGRETSVEVWECGSMGCEHSGGKFL